MRCCAMLAALFLVGSPLAALADRTWDLDGRATLRLGPFGGSADVTGSLSLFDDRTYRLTLEVAGEPPETSSGVWLEEGNRIQLFSESPLPSEAFGRIEESLGGLLGERVRLTSLTESSTIRLNARTDQLRIRVNGTLTVRPGLQGDRPLKVREQFRLSGRLVGP